MVLSHLLRLGHNGEIVEEVSWFNSLFRNPSRIHWRNGQITNATNRKDLIKQLSWQDLFTLRRHKIFLHEKLISHGRFVWANFEKAVMWAGNRGYTNGQKVTTLWEDETSYWYRIRSRVRFFFNRLSGRILTCLRGRSDEREVTECWRNDAPFF